MDEKNRKLLESTLVELKNLKELTIYVDIRGLLSKEGAKFWETIFNGKDQLSNLNIFITCSTSVIAGDETQLEGIPEHVEGIFGQFERLKQLEKVLLVMIDIEMKNVDEVLNKYLKNAENLK
mmetsp:Transcript_39628/g.35393  ORF Transcript_39628/g.35393 Transcript_39628/m.35393 type:complete len:122 (-) Transcript_39628:255-620(-)